MARELRAYAAYALKTRTGWPEGRESSEQADDVRRRSESSQDICMKTMQAARSLPIVPQQVRPHVHALSGGNPVTMRLFLLLQTCHQ